jgi:hypothetical protein
VNDHQAFLLGYLPRAAGPYFNGLELLAEAARTAGEETQVAIRIGEERERVVARRDEALHALDGVEDLLAAAGVPAVVRPHDAGEYAAWADGVFDAVSGAVPGESIEAVHHLLGFVLGEALATVDAIAILARLRELAPDHLWVRLQGDSLERERATAERRLGRLASHPLLAPAVQEAAARAAHHAAERDTRGLADQAAAIAAVLSA